MKANAPDTNKNIRYSIPGYFICLFIKPTETICRICNGDLSYKSIAIFLFCIGSLRGILEGILELLKAGQIAHAVSSAATVYRFFIIKGGPFVLSNIATAYVRWVIYAFLAYMIGRMLGGRGSFEKFLKIYGVIMGIYALTIIPNFAYLMVDMPSIQFNISQIYKPTIGVGQLLSTAWFTFISYKVIYLIHRIPKVESFFIALLVAIHQLALLILGAYIFFNLPFIGALSRNQVLLYATVLFTIVAVATIPVVLWLGSRYDANRRSGHQKDIAEVLVESNK